MNVKDAKKVEIKKCYYSELVEIYEELGIDLVKMKGSIGEICLFTEEIDRRVIKKIDKKDIYNKKMDMEDEE